VFSWQFSTIISREAKNMTKRATPRILGLAAAATVIGFAVGTAGATAHLGVAAHEEERDPIRTSALSMDWLKELNPAVGRHYGIVSPCVPQMGVHYAPVVDDRPAAAPSVVLAVNPVNNELTAVEIIVPSDQPWQPWFDQPEGQPMELGPGMTVWTQHVYLVDPASIDECPPPSE
jgi:hypothetical protein